MAFNPGHPPLLFILLLLLAETNSDIKVQMKQEPIHVLVHEDVSLECLLIGYNNNLQSEQLGVLWNFGEENICSYKAGNLSKNWSNAELYEEDIIKKNFTLVLKNVTINHEGNYRCDVLILPYHRAAGMTTLQVSARPSVTVTSPEAVEVGREASLMCEVNGYYKPSINIEWIEGKNNSMDVINNNVCRAPARIDQKGTYSASVQIIVEPTKDDIGKQYACRVKHRSFPQDHIEVARLTVREQTFDRPTQALIGTVVALVAVIVTVVLVVCRQLYYTVPPKVSEIKALTQTIHKEMLKLKVDVSGFYPCTIQITWKMKHGTRVTKEEFRKLDKNTPYLRWRNTPNNNNIETGSGNGSGEETVQWKIMLSHDTRNRDGTYSISSELNFEPDIERDNGAEIICEVRQEGSTNVVSKQMILNVEGVPPKVSRIITPSLLLHNTPVALTCLINYYKPQDIGVSWYKQCRDGSEEDLDLQLSPCIGPVSRSKGKYIHETEELTFEDHTHSVTSMLTFKATIEEDDGVTYACRISHLTLMEPLEVKETLKIKAYPVMEAISCEPVKPELEKQLVLISKIHSFYPSSINITWWKNDELLPTSGIRNFEEDQIDTNGNSVFVIWSHCDMCLTLEDRGKKLVCRVEHETLSEPMESEYILHEIAMAPKIGAIQCYPTVPEPGKELTLSCEINRYFPKEIQAQWYRGNIRIDKAHVEKKERSVDDVYEMTSTVKFTPTIADHQMELRLEVCHSTISKEPIAERLILLFPGFPLFSPFSMEPPQPQYGKMLALKCTVSELNSEDFAVRWTKKDCPFSEEIQNNGPTSTERGYTIESVIRFIVTAEYFEKDIIFELFNKGTRETYTHPMILPLEAMSPQVSEIKCNKHNLSDGERVTLSCSATEFSPRDIRILWSRGWTVFDSEQSTETLTLEENGLYRLNSELVVTARGTKEADFLCEVWHQQTGTLVERKYALTYS
ncbi:hypothetical protein NDU88_002363 [Pleurodeles waltl]|uniref:Ig-like domain-containing protein n=2 Tax=Pleurodeles waltl TaxID=8319 RepID=A0AAV7TLS2_PLEWA|nr:hypothetical protein NDU88_002363 [Pleurodeles waltl]